MFYSFQSFGKRFYFCCNRYSSLSKVEGAWQESVLRHQQQHQAQEGVQGQVRQAGFWWRNGQLVGSETLTAVQDEIIGTAYLAAAYLEEVTEQTNKQTKLNKLPQIKFDKSKLVYVVGSTGITQELDDVGIKYLPIGVSMDGPILGPPAP